MPKFLEDRLKQEAAAKGMTGDKADAYVYGTMNNLGYMQGSMETAAGKAAQAKHVRDVKTGRTGTGKARGQHPHKNLGDYLHPSKAAAKTTRSSKV